MGQVTQATFDLIDDCLDSGKPMPLTMNEFGQLTHLAYQTFKAATPLARSSIIETQYGVHDLNKLQDWVCINWNTYKPYEEERSNVFFGLMDNCIMSLEKIHENKVVFNISEMRFLKNRTDFTYDQIVEKIKQVVEGLVKRNHLEYQRVLDIINAGAQP